jgi:hypothetical protein
LESITQSIQCMCSRGRFLPTTLQHNAQYLVPDLAVEHF